MSTSAVTLTVNNYPTGLDKGLEKDHVYGTVAIGAGTYATNGLPATFSGLVPGANGTVVGVQFASINGNIYTYDPTNKTIRVYSAYKTEYGNGVTIDTFITGDTIYFDATVNKV